MKKEMRQKLAKRILEDEKKVITKFFNRYYNIPGIKKLKSKHNFLGERTERILRMIMVDPIYAERYYRNTGKWQSGFINEPEVFISMELRKQYKDKVITRAEYLRIKSMTKGDKDMREMAAVIINNYRNKRIKRKNHTL